MYYTAIDLKKNSWQYAKPRRYLLGQQTDVGIVNIKTQKLISVLKRIKICNSAVGILPTENHVDDCEASISCAEYR